MRWATAIVVTVATVGCAPDPPSAVVGVEVRGCEPGVTTGTGVVVADGLVLTTAHTLRGASRITIRGGGGAAQGTIVGFDPELDLAYLAAELPRSVRPIGVDSGGVDDGGRASAWAFRDGSVIEVPVAVGRRVRLDTEDIYVEGSTTRPGLELAASIEPGDSGGPVIVDGAVVGVLWARSTRTPGVAYAIDPDRGRDLIETQLATGTLGDVDPARCG